MAERFRQASEDRLEEAEKQCQIVLERISADHAHAAEVAFVRDELNRIQEEWDEQRRIEIP